MSNTETQKNNGAANEAEQPQIALQRIYIKDASFEAPISPYVFAQEWQPKVELELNTQARKIADHLHEVVLQITITAKLNKQVAYLTEVQQAGVFVIKGMEDESMAQALGSFCPNILFPYAREVIDNLVQKGSFPSLMLAPVNFDALYAQKQLQVEAAQQQANEQTH
jgi:preprotein translocase subunit SecB